MAGLATTALLAHDPYWRNGHMDGDWWWAVLMMSVAVAIVVVLAVWFVRRGESVLRHHQSPEEILRRRLADGSIDVEEYERRLAALERPE